MNHRILTSKSSLTAIRQSRLGSTNLILNTKIDCMVTSKKQMFKSDKFKHHLQAKHLPNNSIRKINKDIYTVVPELLLIQLANSLSFNQLFLLVLEFCGTYRMNEENASFESSLPQITNINSITNYVNRYSKQNPNAHGVKKLKSVLKYAKDNSASPMESRIYIKLCGPPSKGYYGCKNLVMNTPIKLSQNSLLIAGQQIIKPDFCNIKRKVAIEYDSAQFHENSPQGQKDKRRRDALSADKWKTFSLVPAQVNDPITFDVIARKILKALGQDNRLRIKDFEKKRNLNFVLLK